jgi:hypothetical protein
MTDPTKAREIGLSGRRMIEKQVNMKTSALKLMKIYEEFFDRRYWLAPR